ncbi:MAG: Bro-N domain-containing protein [Paludibacteraceae bacterium]|nr:Bro-N domain-containing protein [Paludibacteraceae bacterium]
MEDNFGIQLFEGKKVRFVWDEEQEKYYFSIVDVVQVLTDSVDGRKYWNKLKQRLKAEGNESVTNCHQLKLLASDGKKYKTDVADLEQLFRLVQSVPSKKVEPVKQWLAQLGSQRIDQMIDPELTFQMAVEDYRRQGYSDKWINERMRSIEMRKELTDEWKRSGITEQRDFAILTNVLTQAWSGMTTRQYATTEYSRQSNPTTMEESKRIAREGGEVARDARKTIEKRLGRTVISSEKASDYLRPIEDTESES